MGERGKLITLEGVDGAGKSTHLEFLADALRTRRRHVIVTREPGGTDLAERIRQEILAQPMPPGMETLFLFAARADHVVRVIEPALAAGTWVVCDRFTDATVAYQGAGKGVPLDVIERLQELAHPGLTPARTFIFDCSYEVARERLAASRKTLDRFEREDRDFFERVRAAYLERARAEPSRIRVIDASADVGAIRKAIAADLSGL
ncbi:MAG: dTMP kinase [Burkholderiales bacterium]|nr:dTMP kinase [Burkholderiales bacterium]